MLHRCWLYELLVDLKCEVLAIDYRGCGYSGTLWRPTEALELKILKGISMNFNEFHEIRRVMPEFRPS